MRLKPTLISATIIAALGGLLFGFDTAVISGTTDWLKSVYELNPFWLGFTVAAALIGTIVGAIVAGRPADTFGRRTVLIAIAVLYFVSAVGSALAWTWYVFLFFRFIGGIAMGGASVVRPCISRRSRQPDIAGAWWPSPSSTSSWASCWLSSRTS